MNFRKLPVHRFGFKVAMMLAFCLLQNWSGDRTLVAQQILVRMGDGNELETYKQLKGVYESQLSAAKNRINAQLNDINEACDLSDAQLERLKVACKGAVNSHAKDVQKRLETVAKTNGIDFKLAEPPEEETDDDNERNLFGGGGGMRVVDFDNGGNRQSKRLVESEPIWKNSIKNSLNEEQQEKLKTWQAERKKRIRKAAVDHLIAKADLKLFLTPQQHEKLTAFIDKEYGKELASKMDAIPDLNRRFAFAALGRGQRDDDIPVDDELLGIFSKPQLEIWKTEFQKDLNSL